MEDTARTHLRNALQILQGELDALAVDPPKPTSNAADYRDALFGVRGRIEAALNILERV